MASTGERKYGLRTRSRIVLDGDKLESAEKPPKKPAVTTRKTRKKDDDEEVNVEEKKPSKRTKESGKATTSKRNAPKLLPVFTEEEDKELEEFLNIGPKKEKPAPACNPRANKKRIIESAINKMFDSPPGSPTEETKLPIITKEKAPATQRDLQKKLKKSTEKCEPSSRKESKEKREIYVINESRKTHAKEKKAAVKEIPAVGHSSENDDALLSDEEWSLDALENCKTKYIALLEKYKKLEAKLVEEKEKNAALEADNAYLEREIDKVYVEYNVQPKRETTFSL
uniref:Protein gar2-like n=1 Tax=Steinernema glaseri TaxID=37863 RepID=A0A1I8ALD8_9BILA